MYDRSACTDLHTSTGGSSQVWKDQKQLQEDQEDLGLQISTFAAKLRSFKEDMERGL
jgi:hypothetical protein